MVDRIVSLWGAIAIALSSTVLITDSVFAQVSSNPSHRRALLIGVSKYNYDDKHTEDNLNSDADIAAIKCVLQSKRYGFENADIAILNTPETTTYKAINEAFEKLIADTQPGDLVYVHYSGHGSTIPDPLERKFSHLAQTIVPHDYDLTRAPFNEIKDSDLHSVTDRLLAKKPLLVTMSFDCCYSGGITRGRHKVRGFAGPKLTDEMKKEMLASSIKTSQTTTDITHGNLVVLAACRPDQEAEETDDNNLRPMGLFTFALTQALTNASDKATYRDIMDQAGAIMASRSDSDQTPQCEGQLDNVLMSGAVLPAQSSIEVDLNPDGRVLLKAGQLHNMTVGSVFELFGPEVKNFDRTTPLTTAKITSVDFIQSELNTSSKTFDSLKFPRLKAREKTHAYGGDQLKVVLQGLNKATADYLSAGLSQCEAFALTMALSEEDASKQKYNVKIESGHSDGELVLEREDGVQIDSFKLLPDTSDASMQVLSIRKRLEAELRWRFVKSLGNTATDRPINIEMRVVPVTVTQRDANGKPIDYVETKNPSAKTSNGKITLNDQDAFVLELRNTGSEAAFVTVMDLQQNGLIGPVYPMSRYTAQVDANKLVPDQSGKWWRIPKPYIFKVTPPFGLEVLKVIGTTEPTNFTPLYTTRGMRGMGDAPKNPIAKLLKAANAGERGITADIPVGDWASNSVILETHQ